MVKIMVKLVKIMANLVRIMANLVRIMVNLVILLAKLVVQILINCPKSRNDQVKYFKYGHLKKIGIILARFS